MYPGPTILTRVRARTRCKAINDFTKLFFILFVSDAAEATRSRRKVRVGRDRAPLQDRAAGNRARRTDGQPSRVLRVQAVPEQRAQAGGHADVLGQTRVTQGEDQGRGRDVPRDALLSRHGEQGVRDEVLAARRPDVQPVRVAVEVRGRQQLGRVRERHRRGGLRAPGGVQSVRGHLGVRQGRHGGHVTVSDGAGGHREHRGDRHQGHRRGVQHGARGDERDTGLITWWTATAAQWFRLRLGRVRRVHGAAVAGLCLGRVRIRLLVLLPRRRQRQIVVEKDGRIVLLLHAQG